MLKKKVVAEKVGTAKISKAPGYQKVALVAVSLANALDGLEFSANEPSNILAEHDSNILKKDDRKKGIEDFKNKEFLERFLTENTFHN
ncbi:20598_t:CDS:2, partial [Dentiscutata erythropus]